MDEGGRSPLASGRRFGGVFDDQDRQLVGAALQHAGLGDQDLRRALADAGHDFLAAAGVDHRHGVQHRATALLVFRTAQVLDGARVLQTRGLQRVVVVRGRRRDADLELGDGAVDHLAAELGTGQFAGLELRQVLGEACVGVFADALHDVSRFLCAMRSWLGCLWFADTVFASHVCIMSVLLSSVNK